jgi:hypothetical protein
MPFDAWLQLASKCLIQSQNFYPEYGRERKDYIWRKPTSPALNTQPLDDRFRGDTRHHRRPDWSHSVIL